MRHGILILEELVVECVRTKRRLFLANQENNENEMSTPSSLYILISEEKDDKSDFTRSTCWEEVARLDWSVQPWRKRHS